MTVQPTVTVDALDQIRQLVAAAPDADRLRPIGLREVVSGPAAARTVARVLGRLGVAPDGLVTVLSDAVAKRGGGGENVVDTVCGALAGHYRARTVELRTPASGMVQADEATVESVVHAVASQPPSALVTVGSGTMADIGKVVAQRLDLVHVVVQTAASVNGFADDQSVLLLRGAKRTTPSRWPDALVIDSDVLVGAPLPMTRSGLGDQLSMFTAAADWYLASAVGFDPSFSRTVVDILRAGGEDLLANAGDLAYGGQRAVLSLANALTRGGLAMGLAGRTAPSSGTEHTVSHLLEMSAAGRRRAHASHGSQVGVASVVAAAVWRRVRDRLAAGGVLVSPPDPDRQRERVREAFLPLDPTGIVADECWAAYRRKLDWIGGHQAELRRVCDDWARHEPEVATLLEEPRVIARTLRLAGAPSRFAELAPAPDRDIAAWAVRNCHLMRDRFTVVDLAEAIGLWTPDEVEDVLRETQEVPAWQGGQ